MPDFAVFCCALQNYSKLYRSLPKFNSMNRYSIIVVANQRYGLKRCSGMLGSILDLNAARWFATVILVVKILFYCPPSYKFKNFPYDQGLYSDSHSEQ